MTMRKIWNWGKFSRKKCGIQSGNIHCSPWRRRNCLRISMFIQVPSLSLSWIWKKILYLILTYSFLRVMKQLLHPAQDAHVCHEFQFFNIQYFLKTNQWIVINSCHSHHPPRSSCKTWPSRKHMKTGKRYVGETISAPRIERKNTTQHAMWHNVRAPVTDLMW